ncbi:MAG: hypothetical protein HRF50_05815 [Phycisphaerae bacterium]|jgi:hypothetical protein
MMTLDELAGNWLRPRDEEHFSLPAIVNFRGMAQAAWDISGVQNWTCAPTGFPTPTALLYVRDGGRVRRFPRAGIEYRWKAYEIERRGHGVHTVTRMPELAAAVMQRIRFERPLHAYLVFTGLPRVWRFTDYWNLPPWDVPQMNLRECHGGFALDDCKTFGRACFAVPGQRAVFSDLDSWLNGEPPVERGRLGVAELQVGAGDEITWWGAQGCEEALPELDQNAAWESGRLAWERVWRSAFTPGNPDFSGHLPTYEQAVGGDGIGDAGPAVSLARLYYMSVLSLLMTRRIIPAPTPRSLIATGGQCIWTPPEAHVGGAERGPRPAPPARLERAYVWGGPEGAPTTSFLWEVEFQAPLLARLDPAVLRAQLEALMRVDLRKHWGIETVSGAGAGMAYGVNPGAFLSCVADYVRITGDRAWALRHVDYLKNCLRPELTDYGDCQNILECVSTYEHTVAAFNALAVAGLRFMSELTGDAQCARQADALAAQVLTLFEGGPWACKQPDGSRRIVKTILDFVYVGRCMAGDLPQRVRREMAAYFERELGTEDWLYALAPSDLDALTPKLPAFQTYRADHQATGSYDGWPARAASVLLRFGERAKTVAWLRRVQDLTREGPFGQAHYIHSAPRGSSGADDGFPSRTRKASFFNGNCYFESAGCGFATAILEDLA